MEASPPKRPTGSGFKPGGTAGVYRMPMPPSRSESKSASCKTPLVLAVRTVAAATGALQVCSMLREVRVRLWGRVGEYFLCVFCDVCLCVVVSFYCSFTALCVSRTTVWIAVKEKRATARKCRPTRCTTERFRFKTNPRCAALGEFNRD